MKKLLPAIATMTVAATLIPQALAMGFDREAAVKKYHPSRRAVQMSTKLYRATHRRGYLRPKSFATDKVSSSSSSVSSSASSTSSSSSSAQ